MPFEPLHPEMSKDAMEAILLAEANHIRHHLALSKKIDFVMLPEGQNPVRPERFKFINIWVGSETCDPFILAEKAEKAILEQSEPGSAFVSTMVRILPGYNTKWEVAIKGRLVPTRKP